MFLVSVPRIFKIAGRAYAVELVLVKRQEKFLHSISQLKTLYHPISVLEISKGPLLTGVKSTSYNVAKNELLT